MAAKSDGFLLFDESYYFSTYPDAMLAVENGTYSSGREHWEKEGINHCYAPNGFLPHATGNNCTISESEWLK